MSEDIKSQLWRDVLISGLNGIGRGMRAGANDCMLLADEMVKRYAQRFEPDTDVSKLTAMFDAEKARVDAEREEIKRKAADEQVRQYREQGPWSAGTPLVVKSSGERCEVVRDDRGASVRVKYGSGRSGNVDRGNLGWPEAKADEPEMPTPVGLVQ